jgi:hypothetical protein
LIEAAWSYRFPARISREQLLRQERLAKPIRDIAWKRKNGCADGIAGSPGQESCRRSSLPRSRVSWRALSGTGSSGSSPTSSFFLVSTEIAGSPAEIAAFTIALMWPNWASRSGWLAMVDSGLMEIRTDTPLPRAYSPKEASVRCVASPPTSATWTSTNSYTSDESLACRIWRVWKYRV